MKLYFETSHSESGQRVAVELFYGNSQRVKAIGYFRTRAPSWMFHMILNLTMPNNLLKLQEVLRRSFPPLGLHKGILDSPAS